MAEYDPTVTDEPLESDEPLEDDGDDAIHAPGDGTEDPAEPGAGLGEEVEEPDAEDPD